MITIQDANGHWVPIKEGEGEFVCEDHRIVQCPKCGEMVDYLKRHQHRCYYEHMKQLRADAAEFEIGMAVSARGGRRSWEQYGL